MLRELVKRWANHKVMVRWMSRNLVTNDFIAQSSLPTLQEVGLLCFRNLVYEDNMAIIRDTVIQLINQEREGKLIDRALLKKVIDIFFEIGMRNMDSDSSVAGCGIGKLACYETDFEEAMLANTGVYYSRKAANLIQEHSCPDYLLKVEECLKGEKDRVSNYLHPSTEKKLLEKVRYELLTVYSEQLFENELDAMNFLEKTRIF